MNVVQLKVPYILQNVEECKVARNGNTQVLVPQNVTQYNV